MKGGKGPSTAIGPKFLKPSFVSVSDDDACRRCVRVAVIVRKRQSRQSRQSRHSSGRRAVVEPPSLVGRHLHSQPLAPRLIPLAIFLKKAEQA